MTDVDVAIIGTSPLLLLQAIKDARAGKSVVLFDADGNRGGLWRIETLDDGSQIECACHLVENFPGAYETLAEYSGVPFETLEPQPLRIELGDRRILYASRKSLAAIALVNLLRVMRVNFAGLAGELTQAHRESYDSARLKLTDFVRYTWKQLLLGTAVKGPVPGFGSFIANLVSFAEVAGARFELSEVSSAALLDGRWRLQANGKVWSARAVYCSASSTLARTGHSRFEAYSADMKDSYHLVIEIPKDKVQQQLSYVSFTRDSTVFRISRLDHPDKQLPYWRYLVQLRVKPSQDGVSELASTLPLLKKIGLLAHADDVQLRRILHHQYRAYFAGKQLPDGELAPGFHVLSSAGNLASGVAAWSRGWRRLPWRTHAFKEVT